MDTKKLRQKILDLAIRGKLVPQDPNDEPAIELLKRINPKFEPCGETPWDLPNNWCWTTLGNISNYGKCIHVEAKDIPNDSWVLELEDLEKGTYFFQNSELTLIKFLLHQRMVIVLQRLFQYLYVILFLALY